jgi:hypothetical protein
MGVFYQFKLIKKKLLNYLKIVVLLRRIERFIFKMYELATEKWNFAFYFCKYAF